MAAPSYTTNQTQVTLVEDTTGWSALGGGQAGLTQETDFYIAGNFCLSKQISNALKGALYDSGSVRTQGADDHIYIWIYTTTPGLISSRATGGLRGTFGTGTGAYKEFYLDGNDTIVYGGWKCYPVRYSLTAHNTSGSPGANPQWFGAQLNTTASVKALNLGIDRIAYGSSLSITQGDSGSPASFLGAADQNDVQTNRWGILRRIPGGAELQGKLLVGTASTAAYVRSSNALIVLPNNNPGGSGQPQTLAGFKEIIFNNTASDHIISGLTVLSLDTYDRGRVRFLALPASHVLTGWNLSNIEDTVLISGLTASGWTWNNCGLITQNSATLSGCTFNGVHSSSVTRQLLSNAPSSVSNTEFIKHPTLTHHGMEITTTGDRTLTDVIFTNFGGTGGSNLTPNSGPNDAAIYNNSGGAVTLNISGGTIPSVRNGAGATTTIVAGQVTATFTGIPAGAEIRLYVDDPAAGIIGSTELAGTESHAGGSFEYSYTYSTDTNAILQVIHTGFEEELVSLVLGNANQTRSITLTPEENL